LTWFERILLMNDDTLPEQVMYLEANTTKQRQTRATKNCIDII